MRNATQNNEWEEWEDKSGAARWRVANGEVQRCKHLFHTQPVAAKALLPRHILVHDRRQDNEE